MIKNILKSVVLLFIIIKPLYIHAEWKSIHHDRLFSISGVVSFTDGFLVVHDNKSKGQPRISFINKENTIRPLVWPSDTLPFDLEAIHIIPGDSNEFLVMESGGVCYRVMVKPESKEISIINKFILPKVSKIMNLASFMVAAISICMRSSTRLNSGIATAPTMAATNASFNKPLENSVKDFRLKSLKKPFIGEILSIEGVKLCPLKTKPLTINLKNMIMKNMVLFLL